MRHLVILSIIILFTSCDKKGDSYHFGTFNVDNKIVDIYSLKIQDNGYNQYMKIGFINNNISILDGKKEIIIIDNNQPILIRGEVIINNDSIIVIKK